MTRIATLFVAETGAEIERIIADGEGEYVTVTDVDDATGARVRVATIWARGRELWQELADVDSVVIQASDETSACWSADLDDLSSGSRLPTPRTRRSAERVYVDWT